MIEIETQVIQWIVIGFSLSLVLIGLVIAWQKQFFRPLQISLYPVITGKDVLRGFTFFLLAQLFLFPLIVQFFLLIRMIIQHESLKEALSHLNENWLQVGTMFSGFAGVAFSYFQLTKEQRRQLWDQTSLPWYKNLKVGMLAWFIVFPLTILFSQLISFVLWHLFQHTPVSQGLIRSLQNLLPHPFLFGAMGLTIITLVPLSEEFLFRGLLQSWLKRKVNVRWAIVLTSLTFAACHYSLELGLSNIELLSSLFVLSCVLGFIYERQRSLWASIGLHGFFNAMSLFFVFFAQE